MNNYLAPQITEKTTTYAGGNPGPVTELVDKIPLYN
jgi:hypothetical protein